MHHKTVDTIVDRLLSGSESNGRRRRPNFPKDLKRRLAELSFEPGASVALIARQNDINANLLFRWRQHYLNGDYGLPTVGVQDAKPPAPTPFFLPASISPSLTVTQATDVAPPSPSGQPRPAGGGYCEVDFAHARLKVLGDVSPALLSTLIGELLRAGPVRA